jgi:hypothetical protein
MGRIEIEDSDGLIVVTMEGPMSRALAADMRRRLLPLLQARKGAMLLYDSRKVEIIGDSRISKAFHAFDEEIAPLGVKIASVTSHYEIGTRVGQIHVYSPQHERFYDMGSAKEWLRTE